MLFMIGMGIASTEIPTDIIAKEETEEPIFFASVALMLAAKAALAAKIAFKVAVVSAKMLKWLGAAAVRKVGYHAWKLSGGKYIQAGKAIA